MNSENTIYSFLTEDGLKIFLKNLKNYYKTNTKAGVVGVADALSTPRTFTLKVADGKEVSFVFDGSKDINIDLFLSQYYALKEHTHSIEEIQDLKRVLENLNSLIQEESSRAKEVENSLTVQIEEESSRRQFEDEELLSLINEETSQRQTEDEKLLNQINEETFQRQTEDEKLNNSLNEETSQRQEGEKSLLNSLLVEENARISDISNEKKERQNADNLLDIRLKEVESRDTGKVDDVQVDGVSVVINKIANITTEPLVKKDLIGQPFGIAALDESGKVPGSQLPATPSLQIISVLTKDLLPEIGEIGYIYIVLYKAVGEELVEENTFYRWIGEEYVELGGLDAYLREIVEKHITDKVSEDNHPHGISKASLGLDKVDNTSDSEKPISFKTQEALNTKVNILDIKDNLVSQDTQKPLSAKQGMILDGRVSDMEGKITSLGNPFHFRGTVVSEEELLNIENPEIGDAYQIRGLLETNDSDSGKMYAYTDNSSIGLNGWIQISAAAMDITSYMASSAEVYEIIDNYS